MRVSDWSSDLCSSDLRVQDAARERGGDRPREHGAKAGHDDEFEGVLFEHLHDLLRVAGTVEALTERGALDVHSGHAVLLGYLRRPRRAVDHHELHGYAVGEDGLQQGSAALGEVGDAHAVRTYQPPTGPPSAARGRGLPFRSEERREGTEGDSTCTPRREPHP